MKVPTIPDFYSQQHIFVTGATGFMGKVLIEKLLRSCSDLEIIYVLVRNRKDKSAQERWQEATEAQVFDRLKRERPGILEKKVEVLYGDVKQKKLGLSTEDWQKLQENVSIIFHCAANVRFNDPLPEAVFINLRGSYEVIRLALGMSKLKVLVHISTTYCNNFSTESGEEIYPAPADWSKTIEIAEKLDPRDVSILSAKYRGIFPNTYTFTKNLAERMIWDHRDELPIVIIRPSIVICSLQEPMPGWIDNLYGPLGLMLGTAKGVVRVTLVDRDAIPDYMAVDVAIKSMIIAAWKKGLSPTKGDVDVYNAASRSKGITNGEMIKLSQKVNYKYPINEVLWYPSLASTKSEVCFKYQAILKHFLPAVVVDQVFKMIGKKPMLLKVQISIYNAMMALGYFATKTWLFSNEKFLNLRNDILEEDKEQFNYEFDDMTPEEFIEMGITKGQVYLLKEDESLLPHSRKKLRRLYWLDRFIKLSFKCFLGFVAYKYFF
ncbi:putative fatty acyl-CoA reductase CG5065 [Halyomorpha halys]|uniref:putative fatty acyl-CoA reductase CG5065 n=1 Tax=Halyomorpha halys TaxID=286706 RepID=UPI0006D52065|nr:putative fatty acyl-CoA reductase CG5065 [Halyomorpha halys]XP_014270344.1 putative fatty acyl-CoA reductase CG5065 [Halyomorpha halys]